MKKVVINLLILFFTISCSDSETAIFENSLSFYINNKTIEMGAVISCAASDITTNDVLIFYYPEHQVENIRFYETPNAEVDKTDYDSYKRVDLISEPFFNGYMGKFKKSFAKENWVIITYELNGEIKLSNPIRIKHLTKPTVWTNDVNINQDETTMPEFIWTDNANGDNAIYFQVISNTNNDLLSGTYTYENHFQYYDTSNVILNITKQTPPHLTVNTNYKFTLMDVSTDNWVNTIIQKTFTAK